MSHWDELFQQKIKEVLNHKHKDYEYASLSPRASGNVARALIAEEYYAQADRIAELENQLDTATQHLAKQSEILIKIEKQKAKTDCMTVEEVERFIHNEFVQFQSAGLVFQEEWEYWLVKASFAKAKEK